MAKKYGNKVSSNGVTKTPTRRDGKHADLIRGKSKSASFRVTKKK